MKKKRFIWILAIAIFVPILVSSCSNKIDKNDLVGNYEMENVNDFLFGSNPSYNTDNLIFKIKLSLNEDMSAKFFISFSALDSITGADNKFDYVVEYRGKWEYNDSNQLMIELRDYDLSLKSDDENVQKKLDSSDKKQEILDEGERYLHFFFKRRIRQFDGTKAFNNLELNDNGFTVESGEGTKYKFKKVK